MNTSTELRCRARDLALLVLGSHLLQSVVAAPCPPVLHAWNIDVRTVIIPGRYHAVYNWAVGNLIPRNQAGEVDCARVLKVLPIGLGVGNPFEVGDE